jgi:hypothetical protein
MDLPVIVSPDETDTMLWFRQIQTVGLFLQIGNQVLDGIFPDKGLHLLGNDLGLNTEQPFYEAHQIVMNHILKIRNTMASEIMISSVPNILATSFSKGTGLSEAGDHSRAAFAHRHKRPGVPGHRGAGDRLSEAPRAGRFR